MAPRRKKVDDSESGDDQSDEDAYEDPVDAFYHTKQSAPLYGRQQSRRGDKILDLQREEARINKMLDEQSDEKESEAEQPEEDEAPKGRATGKDLVPCELHPLDHMIEQIIFDRIMTPKPSPSKSKKNKSAVKEDKKATSTAVFASSSQETKTGTATGTNTNEKQVEDQPMKDEVAEGKQEEESKEKKKEATEKSISDTSDEEDEESNTTKQPFEIKEEFLVKYKNLSYLEVQWLTEQDFSNYSYQCQQKLKRYLIKREKLAKGLLAPTTDQNLKDGEYFDPHHILPDKVLTSTNLFPIIHPRQAKNVIGTWRERCILVLQHIMCYKGQEGHFYSTAFIFLRTDERSVMDFTTINNRLYTIPSSAMQQQAAANPSKPSSFYQGPQDFWNDLGLVFIEGLSNYHTNTKEYFCIRRLRELSYFFYLAWRRQIAHIHEEKIKNPPRADKKTNLLEIQQLLNRKSSIDQQIKQAKMQFQAAPNLQNQQALAQLVPQNSLVIQQLDKLSMQFKQGESERPPVEFNESEDKVEAYKAVCNNLPKYLQTLQYEMSPAGQKAGGIGLIPGVTGDPASYRAFLVNALNKLVPPYDVDKEQKPADKQKEAESTALPGCLVLGVNLLSDLGSGEAAITAQKEDFAWLLKKTEVIQNILEDAMFDGEVIFASLMGGVEKVDPIYSLKWQNCSYNECTWEPASIIRRQDETDSKIKDFERFNRSLDNNSRQKMMGFGYAHKQILKIYSKKLQLGRKIDHRSNEELQTREMLSKLLKFEGMTQSKGYFQYNYEQNLVPQFRLSQKCKDYQISGLNWMLRAFQDNRNIVLADEMGLGKTIQTVALLDHLIKICKIRGPFLVIAPLSTLDHWKKVSEEWTYMNTVVFHDRAGQEGRVKVRDLDWYYTDVTNKGTITQKSKLIKFNLMITSYEVFNSELQECLKDVPFQYVIVDEAHRLKNKQAKTLMLLKEHPCRRILLLTGTPIQNNTKELFTLLNYLEPEQFNNFDKFMEKYGMLKSAEQVDQLHAILKPHFLRRLKDEVEDSIPPLKETVIEVSLTEQQQQYYRGIYGENLAMLVCLGQGSVKHFNFNNIDMQLRKCCNHLYLLKGVEEDLTKKFKTEADLLRSMLDCSGKLILLEKFIEKYREDGHKMLVFSQFKGMVEIIKDFLTMKKIRFEILTGNVKSQDRITAIQRFNEDNEFGIFLLTTRAGGLGINLTKARVVVIFDSDWNPQNDLQAIARAHRIGQKFEVEVYRFITAQTYEQQMFDRASKKLGMEKALFQKGAFHDQEGEEGVDVNKINPEEIEKLLKYGAYAFLDQEIEENSQNEEQQAANSLKIEDILKNKKDKKSKNDKKYTYQKTTFTVADMTATKKDSGRSSVNKTGEKPTIGPPRPKLDVNDPAFWEKILPMDGFNSKQLNRKFRSKRNEILKTKESQSKFLKEVAKCVDQLLEAKGNNPSLEIDEEIYDLLKRINKTKQIEHKYRTKATVLLDKILHFNDYRIIDGEGFDGNRLQRKAKQKPKDYKEKSTIHGKRRKKTDSKKSGGDSQFKDDDDGQESDMQSESQEENLKPDKDSSSEVILKGKKVKDNNSLQTKPGSKAQQAAQMGDSPTGSEKKIEKKLAKKLKQKQNLQQLQNETVVKMSKKKQKELKTKEEKDQHLLQLSSTDGVTTAKSGIPRESSLDELEEQIQQEVLKAAKDSNPLPGDDDHLTKTKKEESLTDLAPKAEGGGDAAMADSQPDSMKDESASMSEVKSSGKNKRQKLKD